MRFKNTGKKALELEVLDGLAQLEPYGVDDWALKMQGRNLEGWMNVYNLDEDAGMPWFKLSASFENSSNDSLPSLFTSKPSNIRRKSSCAPPASPAFSRTV